MVWVKSPISPRRTARVAASPHEDEDAELLRTAASLVLSRGPTAR